jgi:hypothetical protein
MFTRVNVNDDVVRVCCGVALRVHDDTISVSAVTPPPLSLRGGFFCGTLLRRYVFLPYTLGAWHFVLVGVFQHAGLAQDVLDHRLNTRTVYINPISAFIYWCVCFLSSRCQLFDGHWDRVVLMCEARDALPPLSHKYPHTHTPTHPISRTDCRGGCVPNYSQEHALPH